MNQPRRWLALAVGTILCLTAACGSDDGSADEDTNAPSPTEAESATTVEGTPTTEAAPAGSDYVIGCIPKDPVSPFWQTVEEGCRDAAEEAGVQVVVQYAGGETNVEEQIAIIEDMLTSGVDALVVAPVDPAALRPTLAAAAESVPVILVDTDIPDWDGKTSFIGTGNLAAGRVAGEFMVEALGGSGIVAVDRALAGVSSVDARFEGFREVVEAAGIEIVAVYESEGDQAQTVSDAEDVLVQYPDLDGIFCVYDFCTLGVVQVIRRLDIDTDEFTLVGFDAIPEVVEIIADGTGTVDADIAQFPYVMGTEGIRTAISALSGQDVDSEIDSGVDVVTIENFEDFLP